MKKLTKNEITQRAKLVEKLRAATAKVEDEIDAFNDKRDELLAPINKAIDDYNEVRTEAEGFVSDLVAAMDDFAGDHSDRWPESEAGQAFESWKSEYESISFDEVEKISPEQIELPEAEINGIDELEAAPEEIE